MAREIVCGIYCIENLSNNKKYIGKSTDIYYRWGKHKYELRRNNHCNLYLQRAWDFHGEENFRLWIIEECKEEIDDREKYWINFYDATNVERGYNLTEGGEGCCGYVHTEETKAILREKRLAQKDPRLGTKHTEETKKMWSEKRKGGRGCFGYRFTDEQRAHLSESHKGNSPSNKGKTYQVYKKYKNSKGEYFGVSPWRNTDKWRCRLRHFGKDIHVGVFETEILAAIAYNEASLEVYGFKAKLNMIAEEEYNSIMINS